MGETKATNGGAASSAVADAGGFRGTMERFMYSGEKKHVFAGLVIVTALFAVPWYYMTQGSKQQSHQDYMEKANKARSERLSSGQPSLK